CRRDPADAADTRFCEPDVAVWSGGDAFWMAEAGDTGAEFGDDACGRDPADAVAVRLGEPQIAVRARRDVRWPPPPPDTSAELRDRNKARRAAVFQSLQSRPACPTRRLDRIAVMLGHFAAPLINGPTLKMNGTCKVVLLELACPSLTSAQARRSQDRDHVPN